MRKFKYPTGIYPRWTRPISHHAKRRNKFNNQKYREDGYTFDSHDEIQYYNLLKFEGKRFKVHPLINYRKRQSYRSKVDGSIHYAKRRNYRPDFVIYDSKGNILEVIDIKGIRRSVSLSYDRMKFDDFSLATHLPVTIVRKVHGRFTKKVR